MSYEQIIDGIQLPDSISLGHWGYYPNGHPENIFWDVIDVSEDKALLLSSFLLDRVPYHKTKDNVTWENSFIRMWLNNNFFENAFSKEEQQIIRLTTVKAEKNPKYPQTYQGNDTQDKIFLLSIDEVAKYKKYVKTKPIDFALSSQSFVSRKMVNWEDSFLWWLRTCGAENTYASCIVQHNINSFYDNVKKEYRCDFKFSGLDIYSKYTFVRPVMWINLSYCQQELATLKNAIDRINQKDDPYKLY